MGAGAKAYCVLLGCLLALESMCISVVSQSSSDSRHVIRLLALVPFPDSRPSAGWDDGLLVLPAARLAVEHINNRPDILPGYKLELIEASSDACGVKTVNNALVNFVQKAVTAENETVVGIVGLACSSVASVISPLAGRGEVSLIQLSMGNSPVFRNHSIYPHLWRVLPSTVAFVDSVISIMKKFNNTKISVIHDDGVLFSTTATEFVGEARKSGLNVTMDITLDGSTNLTRQVNRLMTESNRASFARIIFASVTRPEAAALLCRAYRLQLYWPGFLWIFQTRTVEDILNNINATDGCTEDEMRIAINNTIDVNFQFQPVDPSKNLSSLITYTQYTKQYAEKLEELLMEDRYAQYNLADYANDSVWANVMYDEVWAIGSALNKSLPELKQLNLSLEEFQIGNSNITKIIEKQFHRVSFAGTMGHVSFDSEHQEGQTPLKLRIRNCTLDKCDEIRIGEYNPRTNSVSLNLTSATVPNDEFDIRHNLLPIYASVLLFGVVLAVFLLITYNLFIVIVKWNTHVIKATSPVLSLLIFVGCYILFAASLLRLLTISVFHEIFLTIACSLEVLLFAIGVNLVLGTIVVKLARIFRIFSPFSQMGSGWQSKYLFIAVLVLTFAGSIPAIVWVSSDRPMPSSTSVYDYTSNPPVVIMTTICRSKYIFYWLVSVIVIPSIELIFMIFFAYETRKANVKNFKDTKKIISYVFASVSSFGLFIIVFVALIATGTSQEIAYIFLYLSFPVNAQVFLYIPKTVPLMLDKHEQFTLNKRTFSTSKALKTIASYF